MPVVDTEQTDVVLVRLLQQKNSKAFAQLYERYKNRIYSYCLRLIGDRGAAEDAAHETFMKMFDGINSLRSPESFKPWLFRIARNEAFMNLRKNRSNGYNKADFMREDQSIDEQLLASETSEIVKHHLMSLKQEYREVLILREYDQLSYAQISEVTGDTESSVKSRIFKARKALGEKLRPYFKSQR